MLLELTVFVRNCHETGKAGRSELSECTEEAEFARLEGTPLTFVRAGLSTKRS